MANAKKIIIVGSAGSPQQAIEILKLNEELNFPVIVNIHFTSSAIETFAQHIRSETNQKVTIVRGPVFLEPGVYIPEGGKDLIFLSENTITVVDETTSKETVHPSISVLFSSMKKFANEDFAVVVLSGLGSDGAEHAAELKKKGVLFIIERTPKFPYLTENIARQLGESYKRLEIEKIREMLKMFNNEVKQQAKNDGI
ncbi:chemotaxis protein CheB [Fervidobacterium pennivorans]|jgi:two-component system chemotaxis response regulator CheB|uniref:chemotaxis protein CheB n=1 Tax=Fervidobacterium pennivorans TaxID=93466 RepID=UPI0014367A5E|nr:chemotaxis protein CheB [Fervidobacterium pennivorans]QIV78249.1 chemotaxis protein CheB [Fervidobacterium pennivorans subsp. keratinolyticus]